jgi:hypothetical protein
MFFDALKVGDISFKPSGALQVLLCSIFYLCHLVELEILYKMTPNTKYLVIKKRDRNQPKEHVSKRSLLF